MEELNLKTNILGAKIYVPKTPEQQLQELSQMELNSRKQKEETDAKEKA